MITLVSRWRALFPFLLLCWLVKKSTILAKTEKTGTKYKSFLSLWSYFHCALRSGKSVWSLHQRRPAGAFFCGQCFVSPGIQKVCSFFSQNLMLLLQIPPFSQMPRKRWTWHHPITCVIPVRRWSWKARWKNNDFLLLEQRQNKGMVAKLEIFDSIGNKSNL